MTADRQSVLNYAKTVILDRSTYNFMNLRPNYSIYQLFSPYDIQNLHDIVTSNRYSGRAVKRIELIDQIMKFRGFVKLSSGTNRLCYRFREDNSFVVKVPYNKAGLRDNPDEFLNQRKLMPFCTKVFECTPCGTLASFERVRAITNREEYYEVGGLIYDMVRYILHNGFIMEDIGTKYFLNVGIREGFGPVLLDFSFLYRLDGANLYCTKPDYSSPSGKCDGQIDYDAGINFLYCKKCGNKYKALELSKRIEQGEIVKVNQIRRTNKMLNLTLSGGDKKFNNQQVVARNGYSTMVTPPGAIVKSMNKEVPQETKPEVTTPRTVTVSFGNKSKQNTSGLNITTNKPVAAPVVEEKKEEVVAPVVEEAPVIEENNVIEVAPVEEERHPAVTEEDVKNEANEVTDPVEIINTETLDEAIKKVIYQFGTIVDSEYYTDTQKEDAKELIVSMINSIISTNDDINSRVSLNYSNTEEDDTYFLYDDEEESEPTDEYNEEVEEQPSVDAEPAKEEPAEVPAEEEEYDSEVSRFEAVAVDIHDIVDSVPSENVLLIKNIGAPGYVTVGDNQLLVIDMIDNMYTSTLSVVSSDYLNNLEAEVSKNDNLEVKAKPTGA